MFTITDTITDTTYTLEDLEDLYGAAFPSDLRESSPEAADLLDGLIDVYRSTHMIDGELAASLGLSVS